MSWVPGSQSPLGFQAELLRGPAWLYLWGKVVLGFVCCGSISPQGPESAGTSDCPQLGSILETAWGYSPAG